MSEKFIADLSISFRFGSQIAQEAFEQEVANDVTIYKIMPFFKGKIVNSMFKRNMN